MMPKKSWLPANVTAWTDRHGKTRYRFRKAGYAAHSFRHAPGTEEFREEYAACLATRIAPGAGRAAPFTYDALIASFYRTARWQEMRPSSQATYRGIIERFRAKNGGKDVRGVTTAAIDALLAKRGDTPAAANNLRKTLKRLHRHAIKLGWRADNPVEATDPYRSGPGWHCWTEAEIAAFRARWPVGTRERLALELLLGTGLRVGDAVTVGRQHRRGGELVLHHGKNDSDTVIPIVPELAEAIAAFDSGNLTYLATMHGKPFGAKGFYNWFKRACKKAEIPHCSPHGLRKALSRRLAESGATPLEGRAVTGHKTDRMFAHYAQTADKRALAASGMSKLMANHPTKPVGKPSKK